MTIEGNSIWSKATYKDTKGPIDQATTLPPEVYKSQEWYEKEIETIFMKSWLVATREEEIPNPGDYVRLDIIGEPLIILRDQAGTIRALSASCRHRGSELVSGKGNCRLLVCPYHAWSYSLTGELKAAPSMEDAKDFDKSDYSLPSIRAETWAGFVFINFDKDAKPLLESLGGLPKRFESYKMENMKVTKKWENTFKANWKVWVENSREGYHVRTVHRESLDTYYPGAKVKKFLAEGVPSVYEINTSDNENGLYVPRDATLPFVEGLSEQDAACTHFVVHYPHLLLNLPPDRITFHQYFPEGPEWTRIVTWCCFPESTIELENFERDAEEKYYPPMELFIAEDKGICELVQRGIGGRMAERGRFCPTEEKTVHEFASYVVDHVLGDEDKPASADERNISEKMEFQS
ncbi:aromatic ring-hydroxylating oxygenase subunit alpha [Roseovarius sp. ZX-A-9]|uniref:aromatic ring-hydroxylating oxygenase subunit alpha n=1 Tax=Roseovarius sp. ZX-A-9 TaxID=3014783 RepID=UPI002330EC74|nr:aromatic ring-hydroxylating dioxygenase subunit alpha [Roseovarius sp. ZX-A-9]